MVQSVCRQRNGLRSSHRAERIRRGQDLINRIRTEALDLLQAYMNTPKTLAGKGKKGKNICKQIAQRLNVLPALITGSVLGRAWQMK